MFGDLDSVLYPQWESLYPLNFVHRFWPPNWSDIYH